MSDKRYWMYDLETDNLLPGITKIHCAVFESPEGEIFAFHDRPTWRYQEGMYWNGTVGQIKEFMEQQENAVFVAHNGKRFDEKVLRDFCEEPQVEYEDTQIMSELRYPDMLTYDWAKYHKTLALPKKLWGRHSLKAWGIRTGEEKDEYTGGFEQFNPDMLRYCVQDVIALRSVFNRLWLGRSPHHDREDIFAGHAANQNTLGCTYNLDKAHDLLGELVVARAGALQAIRERWPDRTVVEYTPVRKKRKEVTLSFNPRSSKQLIEYLTPLGYNPLKKTDKGQPSTEEDELVQFSKELHLAGKEKDALDVEAVTNYRMVSNRLTKLEEGKSAFAHHVREDGRLLHFLKHIGTTTHRCAHSAPPIGQVTSVKKPYGKEFRNLFEASPGYKLVGGDLASCQLRLLAHELAAFDGGEYAKIVLHGDPHDYNLSILQKYAPKATRDTAKTFFYALIFGAAAKKIGSILGISPKLGKKALDGFMKDLTGYDAFGQKLRKSLQDRKMGSWEMNRWGKQYFKLKPGASLIGLDGRRIPVRSDHSLINFHIQTAEAVVMKECTNRFHDKCAAAGLTQSIWNCKTKKVEHGDYAQVLHVHDEMQVECLPEHVEKIERFFLESASETTEVFSLRCPMAGDVKNGDNWFDTH